MIVATPIGNLKFDACVDGHRLDASAWSLRVGEISPTLPPGMSVTRCVAVLFTLRARKALENIHVSAAWDGEPPGEGRPASGERLDAQAWDADGTEVVLGTEDSEALATRLPGCGFRELNYPVSYEPDGLVIEVPIVPAGSTVTLHFIVAVDDSPEPVESTAWFAADVAHEHVLLALGVV